MARVSSGDHSALECLLDRHGSSVYGYCMRTLSNQASAEDATQEAWLKVVHYAGSYRPEGHFKAWLMTIARNCVVSLVRKDLGASKREEPDEERLASDFDLESELLKRYDISAIRSAIDGLAPAQKAVLMLWLEEDASYESIGERLGLPYVSVRSMLCRARENLKKRLERK